MSGVIFWVLWASVTTLFVFLGILMLIASDRSMTLLYRILNMEKFRESSSSWRNWSRLQWRLAGIVFTTISVYAMVLPLYWAIVPSSSRGTLEIPSEFSGAGKWILPLMLGVLFLSGSYLSIKPHGIVGLTERMMPSRDIPQKGSPSDFAIVRIFGVMLMLIVLFFALILHNHWITVK